MTRLHGGGPDPQERSNPSGGSGALLIHHCVWRPGSERAGRFFLWAESTTRDDAGFDKTPGSRTSATSFPYQASRRELLGALRSLLPGQMKVAPDGGTHSLLLPTVGKGEPIASSPLINDANASVSHDGAAVKLAPWTVDGFELPLEDAVELLVSVSEGRAIGSTGTGQGNSGGGGGTTSLIGADLAFWSKTAKLLLDLLVRQRYVPYLEEEGDRPPRSVWMPLLIEKEDVERVRFLVESMPPVCRAGDERDPQRLVDSFLAEGTDAMVRRWASAGAGSEVLHEGGASSSSLGARWFVSLLSPGDGRVEGDPQKLVDLRDGVRSWVDEVYSAAPRLRCCFRLEAPDLVPPAPEKRGVIRRRNPDAPGWTLSYFLQASDDPSLLVPADEVWRGQRKGAGRESDAAEMEAAMMKGLGKASRLCLEIDRSLRLSPMPTHARLSVDEAGSFLASDAWLLKESGFGVLVPAWSSGARGSRLQVRLKAKAPQNRQRDGEGAGLFTLQSIVQFEWKVAVGADGGLVLTEEEFMRLVSLKQRLVSVRGQWIELQEEDIGSALEILRSYRDAGGIPARDVIELATAGVTVGNIEVKVTEGDGPLGGAIQQLTSRDALQQLPTPGGFGGVLRPYQVRGFSWLAFMRRVGLGACLADDMGLGKTVQLIAMLLHAASGAGPAEAEGCHGTLLVCPTSIIGNWKRELARFAPSVRVLVHHGDDRLGAGEFAAAAQIHDIVITSYQLMARDVEALAGVDWATVALDEAQNIKNGWTKQARAAKRLRASHRVALTGTPIENRLSELWSIMDYLNPGYLGSLQEFRKRYSIPIERYGDVETQRRLRTLAQPFILRRLKTDRDVIDDLPEKIETKVYCNLTEEQASLYEAYVKEVLVKIKSSEGIGRRGLVLAALTRLKQICDHPALFLADRSRELGGRSGKMERLTEMLEEVVSTGEKALVFTQYAEMGEMLREHLQASLGCETLFLHGGVTRKARDEMVLRFQGDGSEEERRRRRRSGTTADSPSIFVLSLRAGGLGLNLTQASHVFHFDRWWNPAVENQATDRAHRIGQTRRVQVHKLISGGTLEDKVDAMIERKKGLAEEIIGTGEAWLTELSTDELRDVFSLRRDGGTGEA